MATEIITREDLNLFRLQLLKDLKELLFQNVPPKQEAKWIKSAEVRRMLHISHGTLQNLRITGKLQSSKIGGTHYYRTEDIKKLLENALDKPFR